MIQRERELEGDEFKDKDAFVTQAYKDQMEEVRKAEEEERQRDGMYCAEIRFMIINSRRTLRRSTEEKGRCFHRPCPLLSQDA